MPKHFFKKYTPTPQQVSQYKAIQFLGTALTQPNLWHLNRRSVAGAAFFGIFCSFLPMPMQMVPAALLAIYFGTNLPITLALVWISNPVTYVPLFYFAYRIGAWLIGDAQVAESLEWSTEWLWAHLPPLLFGSLICGLFFGALGYIAIRLLWRWHVVKNWEERKERRRQQKLQEKPRDSGQSG